MLTSAAPYRASPPSARLHRPLGGVVHLQFLPPSFIPPPPTSDTFPPRAPANPAASQVAPATPIVATPAPADRGAGDREAAGVDPDETAAPPATRAATLQPLESAPHRLQLCRRWPPPPEAPAAAPAAASGDRGRARPAAATDRHRVAGRRHRARRQYVCRVRRRRGSRNAPAGRPSGAGRGPHRLRRRPPPGWRHFTGQHLGGPAQAAGEQQLQAAPLGFAGRLAAHAHPIRRGPRPLHPGLQPARLHDQILHPAAAGIAPAALHPRS